MVPWRQGVDVQLRVCDLISSSGGWDVEKLGQFYTVEEQNAILDIPLMQTASRDRLIWNYNRNGNYTVKSGYWLALKEVRSDERAGHAAPVVSEY
jgi:hypothetical protein